MTRDELLDKAVGKCVPVRTENWGLCQTHHVGWGPGAFGNGRCWHVEGEIKAVEIVLFFLGAEVEALREPDDHDVNGHWNAALDAVLVLIDGSSE